MGFKIAKRFILSVLPACLFSCLSGKERPKPFPNLVVYQGAERFSFGSERERFITSVPDERGGRIAVSEVVDTFLTSRGFLLHICILEGTPNEYRLYKYDYEKAESEYLSDIYPSTPFSPFWGEGPCFLSTDSDYSPCFIAKYEDGSYAYSFLNKDNAVVSLPNEDGPIWVGESGYATTTKYHGAFEKGQVSEDDSVTFHYYSEASSYALGKRARVLFCDESKVIYRDGKGLVSEWPRLSSSPTASYGTFEVASPDRNCVSLHAEPASPYVWKKDYESGILTIATFKDGTYVENRFPSDPPVYNCISKCLWFPNTNHLLGCSSCVSRECYHIDLDQGEVTLIPSKTTMFSYAYPSFDYPVYQGERYDLIERYRPSARGIGTSAIYAHDKEKDTRILVQAEKTTLFSYQRIVELL